MTCSFSISGPESKWKGVKGELRRIPYSHSAESWGCSSPLEQAAEPGLEPHEQAGSGCVLYPSAVVPGHPRDTAGFIKGSSRAVPGKDNTID